VRRATPDTHLFFCVRSFSANGYKHVLQYAFVDDYGNVVLSAFAASDSPVGTTDGEPPEALPIEPLDPEALEYLLTRICDGATLVTFGKVLQGGLLPRAVIEGADQVRCAWRRFLQLNHPRRSGGDRYEPWTLDEALDRAGLKRPDSDDGAVRALAIRDLWRWMDQIERPDVGSSLTASLNSGPRSMNNSSRL